MADAGSVIKKGVTIELEGKVYRVEDFQHVKPGKGAAFIRTKLKDVINGGVVEKSFRPAENVDTAHVERTVKQYLYKDDDFYHFMDAETYDQIDMAHEDVEEEMKFVKENENVTMLSHNGSIFAVEPPLFVELDIIDTEPGFKGNTATGTFKPATVETGAVVQVPLFVNQDDKIKIDTRTGEYISRV
ncbi:MAG: elongation factor P [Clostridiales bacterium]|nr:elongation factor P [Clostridiales bacterium]